MTFGFARSSSSGRFPNKSAPNVNVSHSVCDFVARHKSSVFDGAPMSPSARRQTNRKSLGTAGSYSGGWSQAAAGLAGKVVNGTCRRFFASQATLCVHFTCMGAAVATCCEELIIGARDKLLLPVLVPSSNHVVTPVPFEPAIHSRGTSD